MHFEMLVPTHNFVPKSHPLTHLPLVEVSHHPARSPGRDHIPVQETRFASTETPSLSTVSESGSIVEWHAKLFARLQRIDFCACEDVDY